jgi:UDP-2,3-diacylglucosamine pyrophosphatase LpxH
MDERHIIVISDLHISAAALDDFDRELEQHFVGFLEDELAQRPYPLELVINGDFLDFVQAPPHAGRDLQAHSVEKIPLCFTQRQSREKLAAIHAAHVPTFRALGRFLAASNANTIVVLPGNHDPDFFWPDVREDFIRIVSGHDSEVAKRIRIHLQPAYRPFGCPEVWIEHGHQYDPVNSFFVAGRPLWSEQHPPILADGKQERRLCACLGTRFLIDYLNNLDAEYSFVDNVKPFSRFVRLFLVSVADINFGPTKAAVAGWRMLEYLSKLALSHPKDLLGVEEFEEKGRTDLLTRLTEQARRKSGMFTRISKEYPDDRDLRLLLSNPAEQDRILEWLADNLDLLEEPSVAEQEDLLSLDGFDDDYLSLAQGFRLNETALLVDASIRLLSKEREDAIELVIMGHTHEPVKKPEGLNYYNTGSWTRYYRFDDDNRPSSWSILRDQSYVNFPYALNYVDVDVDHPSSAQMICFKSRDHD